MKALSLKQPFAELIVTGKKTIELRKWNTRFWGTFLVHASKTAFTYERFQYGPESLPLGAIVGKVDLVGVKTYNSEEEWKLDQSKHLAGLDFITSCYGFVLQNAVKFENPIPCTGSLNFWNVSESIIAKLPMTIGESSK